ncbi:MAG: protein translocase subunit SecF [Alphaproteobacteria bacterium]|jgi:preprotein translocase subunit SecF|nr:protein translocase subunit SecF [Rickettsiaceae bacterium]NBU52794.1 protein translocase subunit SecF [Alphaproteobacteria bacterium]UCM93991.1 MAG: protein translocase subunit SecF [Candidatus Megaira endosymbiont of Mesostigma viride]HJK88497.1 protein translocase subunit SecF [Candidatus Megaira endosymbiont of Mesostigma viride]
MQLFPLKIFPSNTNFDFMRVKNLNYALSVFLFILSLVWIGIYKFNFGIDFAGGISMELRINQTPDLAKMRMILNELNIGEIVLQNFGSDKDISIRAGISSEENLMHNIELIKSALKQNFPYEIEYRKVDFVGPQVGNQMIQSGIMAMLLSFLSIMVYIWIRFEWQFGIGVLAALIHDAVLSLGFLSATKLDFNLSTIAAILTIIGYSVNDTVVIYDRIRENLRKYNKKTIGTIINMSVNETLSRTTITVFTTLLANLALILYGGEAIKSFSVLVFFGILIGTYSSIFISAPIITLFNFKNLK